MSFPMVLYNTPFEFQMMASYRVCMYGREKFITFLVTTAILLSES